MDSIRHPTQHRLPCAKSDRPLCGTSELLCSGEELGRFDDSQKAAMHESTDLGEIHENCKKYALISSDLKIIAIPFFTAASAVEGCMEEVQTMIKLEKNVVNGDASQEVIDLMHEKLPACYHELANQYSILWNRFGSTFKSMSETQIEPAPASKNEPPIETNSEQAIVDKLHQQRESELKKNKSLSNWIKSETTAWKKFGSMRIAEINHVEQLQVWCLFHSKTSGIDYQGNFYSKFVNTWQQIVGPLHEMETSRPKSVELSAVNPEPPNLPEKCNQLRISDYFLRLVL